MGSMAMLLSFNTIRRLFGFIDALFNPSNANPPVIEPSPIIATTCRFSPFSFAATDIPNAADIEVEECPTPNASYSLSLGLGKPHKPLNILFVLNASRRPVNILCPYA